MLYLVVHMEEVDLIKIIVNVVVTLTEATNVVTERQSVMHVAK